MNEEDIFKEQLRSVFSDYEVPVPSDGWERLEQSLDSLQRTRIVRRNWFIGSAAATVAILLGSLFFFNLPKPIEPNVHPVLAEEMTSGEIKIPDMQQEIEVARSEFPVRQRAGGGRQEVLIAKYTEREATKSQIASDKPEHPEQMVVDDQIEDLHADNDAVTARSRIAQPDPEEIERLVKEFEHAGKATAFEGLSLEEENKKPMTLAINAKGGLTSSRKIVNSPMTLRSTSAAGPSEMAYAALPLNTMSVADNVAQMVHDQPVSIGLTISRSIVDRLSVETGVVYTYLFSRAKNTSVDFQNQETQLFHYLGIPVNLNYNFVNIGRLGMFVSFGGMVEKDIYGEFRKREQSVSKELNSTAQGVISTKISQKNPQISVNAGVGLFYPIYGGFNLYGKIGGAYYFDAGNYDYRTIYTDKKIVFDLNAGIRFDF